MDNLEPMNVGIDFLEVMESLPKEDQYKLLCADQNIIDSTDFQILQLKRALKRNGNGQIIVDNISEGSSISNTNSSSDFNLRIEDNEVPAKRARVEDEPRALVQQKRPSKSRACKQDLKDSAEDDNEDRCEYCNEKGFLICCDNCPAAFHRKCHPPTIQKIPEGKFECYRCSWNRFYEHNPIHLESSKCANNGEIDLTTAKRSYQSKLLLQFIRTSKVISFNLPKELKKHIPAIPSILPNDEPNTKGKRKVNKTKNCYVCQGLIETRDVNRCYFCSNVVHLDCDPQPSCSTKFYVWRCPMHLENYLDTYFLTSTSVYTRINIWKEFARQPLDFAEVERKFIQRLSEEALAKDFDDAADGLRALKYNFRRDDLLPNVNKGQNVDYTGVEKRMVPVTLKMLFNDLFREPSAVAAFFPAFKTSTPPLLYDRRRPISFGTSNKCSMNLSQFLFNCSNMSSVQLEVYNKQGIDYLRHGNSNVGYTSVNGKIFLMERPRKFTEICQCISSDRTRVRQQQVRNHVAVFPDKIYTIQMGCAVFYMIFNPILRYRS
ncbi:hypothetical protein M3Y96_00888300 [Aphelenchoides besseyi]|nr:hypothetical protein M3Y96_00888300 [Aphelenchoides besseyi]